MTTLFARKALLSKGWTDDVRLTLDDGRISDVQSGAIADGRWCVKDAVHVDRERARADFVAALERLGSRS